MSREPTGGKPGRPQGPSAKPTKKQLRFLLLERRIRFPDLKRATLFHLSEPELIFRRGPGLSSSKMAKRLGVSRQVIHKWRNDPACQRWMCELIEKCIGRKLARRRPAPVIGRTKGEADHKLMNKVVEEMTAQQTAKRPIKKIADIALGDRIVEGKPVAYEPKEYLNRARVARALWIGDKPTEWFHSQRGDREIEPAGGGLEIRA